MKCMFKGCVAFNQPISGLKTSLVTDMSSMFYGCSAFDQPVSTLDTSNVTTTLCMFMSCSKFNQPVGSFNTAKVTTMSTMFHSCPAFNQPLDALTFSALNATTSLDDFKMGTGVFSTANYDALLLKWKATLDGFGATVPTTWKTMKPNMGNAKYTKAPSAAAAAHAALKALGWTITDGGPTP